MNSLITNLSITQSPMKYKVLPQSKLYNELVNLAKRSEDANVACGELAIKLGFKDWYSDPDCIAGGVVAFKSNTRVKGYQKLQGVSDAWVPKDAEVVEMLASAPRVHFTEVNNLVGLSDPRCAKVYIYGQNILIAVPEDVIFIPSQGMEEILVSEFAAISRAFGKQS